MRVALTVADFLNRAALVYGNRTAVVDEASVPGSYGTLTYRELEARARGMALALDDLGVDHGERGRDRQSELRAVPDFLLRCQRVRPHPGPDQLPVDLRGDRVCRATFRSVSPPVRP